MYWNLRLFCAMYLSSMVTFSNVNWDSRVVKTKKEKTLEKKKSKSTEIHCCLEKFMAFLGSLQDSLFPGKLSHGLILL
ncbi:hypothetical protein Patl1_08067 [Pistacia atlantica]|uniref:Uncharacterized protein n=1 Tax=Pistacia atlantica TaxID=434234 RepID=A0ACC1AE60_9ROSI|nr:hypothetical protein Patl1_08067 [Pistacia atlantica]